MTDFTHSLAILIGIDAYSQGIPQLTTAVNDAARLAALLAAQHSYETILLTEPDTGQPVTQERLRTLFTQELPTRLGDDDRLLIYFAGHGVALDGDDGPRGYLVPQDARLGDSATMLAMTDLHAWLSALPCRHMLAILDCCFAGAFRWASTRHIGALPDVIHKERYDRYLLSPAWQVLTSAAYDQKALDVLAGDGKRGARADDRGLHSPFALALFDALEKGDADLVPKGQGDGVITATELYMYLREQVEVQAEEQASHEQTPGLWPLNKHGRGEFVFLVPGHPLNLPPAPDLTAELNPYRGLKSYDQQHAPLFFGREDEILSLVQRVDAQPFLAVLGASGTGKSSLVKAGLLPRLEARSDDFSRPASAEATEVATTNVVCRVLPPMRPTDHPVQALAALLHAELHADLTPGDDALAQILTRWAAAHPGRRLALTIDQFEELATLCRDDAERERFLRLLALAVQQQPAALRLIITLRTDFEPQFTQHDSPLAAMWQAGRYVVPTMDIEDLRQVIEGPASVRVLYFDPSELVDDLIKEVIQTPGALPLLSFTLSELYVKYVQSGRDDRALSGADYRALGGVVGSLRNRASEEYDALPDDAHRATMQRVMLRMVAAEGGGELARRRVTLSELNYPTAVENTRVQAVLDRLVAARLLVRGTGDNPDGTKGDAYVEPAHDALVLAWDRLLRWKKEAEEYLPLQRRLAQAASEWDRGSAEAKNGLLWDDDPRLPQVEETLWPTGGKQRGLRGRIRWARQVLAPKRAAPPDTKWLNGIELAFTHASVSRRAGTFRRIIGITAAVVLALAGLAIFASFQANQATIQRDVAVTAEARAGAAATRALNAESTAVAEATRALNAEATAVTERDEARRQQALAEAGRLAALASNYATDRDIDRALLLSVESYHAVDGAQGLEPPVTARSAVLNVLQQEPFLAGILTLPIPTVYTCASDEQERQLIHTYLGRYDQEFADRYIKALSACRPECEVPGGSAAEQLAPQAQPSSSCLTIGDANAEETQLLDQKCQSLAQRYVATGRQLAGCYAPSNGSLIAMQVSQEPVAAGGVGTVAMQLRLWRVPQWNAIDVEVVGRCDADMLETGWRFTQQDTRLSIWPKDDQATSAYQLVLPGPSDAAGHYDNYTVKRVAVAPNRSAVVAIVASGRHEDLLEVILWDGTTRQLIGTLYTSDAWHEVNGDLDGAYGLRMVGNDKAQVCHVARDPLLANTPMSNRLILVTLQLDEQHWLDQACWTAGRNLRLEEWERYFGDVPYRATCSQWPAGN